MLIVELEIEGVPHYLVGTTHDTKTWEGTRVYGTAYWSTDREQAAPVLNEPMITMQIMRINFPQARLIQSEVFRGWREAQSIEPWCKPAGLHRGKLEA